MRFNNAFGLWQAIFGGTINMFDFSMVQLIVNGEEADWVTTQTTSVRFAPTSSTAANQPFRLVSLPAPFPSEFDGFTSSPL